MKNLNKKLFNAAQKGDTERVKFLVKHGAEVNAKCENGMTALHIAAKNNHKETAVALINLNADIFIRDNSNKTPFQKASFFKRTFWAMYEAVNAKDCQRSS